MVAGAFVQDGVTAAILIAIAAASSNSSCWEPVGARASTHWRKSDRAGRRRDEHRRTSGRHPKSHYSRPYRAPFLQLERPLYLTGLLYCLGAVAWCMVDASQPVWPEREIS
jgi:hypothetical protein